MENRVVGQRRERLRARRPRLRQPPARPGRARQLLRRQHVRHDGPARPRDAGAVRRGAHGHRLDRRRARPGRADRSPSARRRSTTRRLPRRSRREQPNMPDAATAPARPATDVPFAVDVDAIALPARPTDG